MFQLCRRGYELSHIHVDDHAQILADEDGVEASLGRVNLEAQSREQGEGVDLQDRVSSYDISTKGRRQAQVSMRRRRCHHRFGVFGLDSVGLSEKRLTTPGP